MTGLARGLVVFVVPDFEPTIGGTTRQTANQARALLARGYDAMVLTQRIDASWPREEVRDGLRVVRLGPRGRGSVAMKLVDADVARWLRRHRRAIAIVHVLMYPDFAVAAVAAGLGRRTVLTWAGVGDATDTIGRASAAPAGSARRGLRAARRRVLERGGVTHVALTGTMADEVAEARGRRGHPLVIPTAVDVVANVPPSDDERAAARTALGVGDEVVVVFAGHLRALKRVDRLIEAMVVLRDEGFAARLFVLGDTRPELSDCADDLRRQAEAAQLGASVVFAGGVPDIRPYLRAADAFVLPSDREGLSNALLEALACGVPCVAPASAGGDQVLDATCGAVPASAQPADLAAAIREVTGSSRRAELARGARDRALRFSVEAVTGRYERLYDRIGVAGFELPRSRNRQIHG
jgi:glycosyltransferase involved in cell wall biosynthesis